jgi:hypothetical protein
MIDDDVVYRKKSTTHRNEDSDYYGYTDNNAGKILDTDISPTPLPTFRKHKKNKVSMVRKVKKTNKKCKCK